MGDLSRAIRQRQAQTRRKTELEKKDAFTEQLKEDEVLRNIDWSSEEVEYEEIEVGYRDGAEGMIFWCEENVCLPIYPKGEDVAVWTPMKDMPRDPHPVTGKSYWSFWEAQKVILREALKPDPSDTSKFFYRLLCFCWMRGEGKSLIVCLIQLWKFFNWTRQLIVLGANSKDQVQFVHFDIMRDIILNSPKLLAIVGSRNIQAKEIRITDSDNHVKSLIRSISSFSGIVSNITGFTFSEMFDMKNPKFYTQLYGSIRNIPNALGTIDSTVSGKEHVLYQLYENARTGKSKRVFFSYRYSPEADPFDYWNPLMDSDQLSDYKVSFPFGEFDRYFRNVWGAGQISPFSEDTISIMNYIGSDGNKLNTAQMKTIFREVRNAKAMIDKQVNSGLIEGVGLQRVRINALQMRLERMDNYYRLDDKSGRVFCSSEDLAQLGHIFDTDWIVLSGSDMSDPTAIMKKARTIWTLVAKGLPGSKSNLKYYMSDIANLKYLYLLIGIAHVETADIEVIKTLLEEANSEFDGIDMFCSEKYGSWNMEGWCEDNSIECELISPVYDRQRDAMKEFFVAADEGRYKKVPIAIPGIKMDDLLDEEFGIFTHDPDKRWFGSPEKNDNKGIQDDTVFAQCWAIYGGRTLGPEHLRPRGYGGNFGVFIENKDLLGDYA